MTGYSDSDGLIGNLLGLLSFGDAVGFREADPLIQRLQTELGITMPKRQGASVYFPLDATDKGLVLERQGDELLFLKLIEDVSPHRQHDAPLPSVLLGHMHDPPPTRTVTMTFEPDGTVHVEPADQEPPSEASAEENAGADADALLDHAEQALDRASHSLDELSAIKSKL